MCKSQEIETLREVAAKLGPDSYCGPWLSSVADEVKDEIRSDFFPSPSIAATKKECDKMRELARAAATEFENTARAKADAIVKEATDRAGRIVDRAAAGLRDALAELRK